MSISNGNSLPTIYCTSKLWSTFIFFSPTTYSRNWYSRDIGESNGTIVYLKCKQNSFCPCYGSIGSCILKGNISCATCVQALKVKKNLKRLEGVLKGNGEKNLCAVRIAFQDATISSWLVCKIYWHVLQELYFHLPPFFFC